LTNLPPTLLTTRKKGGSVRIGGQRPLTHRDHYRDLRGRSRGHPGTHFGSNGRFATNICAFSGAPDATLAEIRRTSPKHASTEFILEAEIGYETVICERKVVMLFRTASAQRIAIASGHFEERADYWCWTKPPRARHRIANAPWQARRRS